MVAPLTDPQIPTPKFDPSSFKRYKTGSNGLAMKHFGSHENLRSKFGCPSRIGEHAKQYTTIFSDHRSDHRRTLEPCQSIQSPCSC